MEVAESIGAYKKKSNMTILQPNRWEEVVENSLVKGRKRDLSDRFTSKIFKAIHEESISKQTAIMNGLPKLNGSSKTS
jgi:chorismate mutase